MTRTVFLAGASGVIGAPLARMLVAGGWRVHGSTRSLDRAKALRDMGVSPVVVDVFDASALAEAVSAVRPDVVVHQLTDLPAQRTPQAMVGALERNARLRKEGTRHLVAAALAAGCTRMVAQSIAWAYAPGPLPHAEDDPLDIAAQGERATTVEAVCVLESAVLQTAGLSGTVLRYGKLYGPGTWSMAPSADLPLHVDDAARAAFLAVEHPQATGVFNLSEPDPQITCERAARLLGWAPGLSGFQRPVGSLCSEIYR
ncbi:NAD-dependent epimerase/dehydratase family protein [Variovorax ginsengisoli]|uniref:Nucleoside-diphosphate-sugar epimerase n=1 Tax=Variovorax ginsengisoli TaxID=363844 RepID=A0ABT9S4N8_9BURK|nr:NAD(P)-dependent oxidoreductase [Variovorax ginsengisoli]MDP9899322.1 nucleoside-diphosphate-sugar epimerase [Variovorax ginsengisoli]